MDLDALVLFGNDALLYGAVPLLILAAVVLSARLGMPQFSCIISGIKSSKAHDPEAAGEMRPHTALILSSVATYGVAGTVGAATAIGIAGPAVIAWSWILALFIAPLAMAEAFLARTDVVGGAQGPSLSMPRHLWRSDIRLHRYLGGLLAVSVVAVGTVFFAGVHGASFGQMADLVLPTSSASLLLGCAVVAAGLAIAGPKRAGALTSWLGMAGMLILVVTCIWACLGDPGRAFTAIPRSFAELFGGTPPVAPFIGAAAGQTAVTVLLLLVPPLVAPIGLRGSIHAMAQARTTKGQAKVALLGCLVFALLTTLVGMSVQAAGSYYRPVEGESSITELTLYRTAPETVSQRAEADRLHSGVIRIIDGEIRDRGPEFVTSTGAIEDPEFYWDGELADVALRYQDGVLITVMRPREEGILDDTDRSEWGLLTVRAERLPTGAAVWTHALRRGTDSPLAPRLGLVALLLLLAVAGATWGMGLPAVLPARAPAWLSRGVTVLPAAALGLIVACPGPELGAIGLICISVLAVGSAVALLLYAQRVGQLRR